MKVLMSFEIGLTVHGGHRYKLTRQLQDLWVKNMNSFLFDIVLSITAETVDLTLLLILHNKCNYTCRNVACI